MFYLLNITINFNAKKKMKKGFSKFIPLLLSFVDILLLIGSFLLANYLVFSGQIPNFIFYNTLIIGWSILWVAICLKFDLYDIPRIFLPIKFYQKCDMHCYLFFFKWWFDFFLSQIISFHGSFLLIAILFFSVFITSWRFISFFLKKYRKKGYNTSSTFGRVE